jgi:hypothetical protein
VKFDKVRVSRITAARRKDAPSKTALVLVLEKFPEAVARIRELFHQSPSFRSLCEDYRDCLAAWQYWRQAPAKEAPALCHSYAELLRELEQDVRLFLEPEPAPGSRSGKGEASEYY